MEKSTRHDAAAGFALNSSVQQSRGAGMISKLDAAATSVSAVAARRTGPSGGAGDVAAAVTVKSSRINVHNHFIIAA